MKLSKIITRINRANLTERMLTRLVNIHGCSPWSGGFLEAQIALLSVNGKITKNEARKFTQHLMELNKQ